MIHILWEFIVHPAGVAEFERAYGDQGAWARLFSAHAGYLGTTLLRDTRNPRRFLTIDRWETHQHYAAMRDATVQEYARLDTLYETLTESEVEAGTWETP